VTPHTGLLEGDQMQYLRIQIPSPAFSLNGQQKGIRQNKYPTTFCLKNA
jgi:hypothetical protein